MLLEGVHNEAVHSGGVGGKPRHHDVVGTGHLLTRVLSGQLSLCLLMEAACC